MINEHESIKRYYDEVYHGEAYVAPRVSRHLRRVAKRVSLKPGQRVLDVACGKGEWLMAVFEQGAIPTGIDLSSTAIDVCRAALSVGEFHEGPAEELPFDDSHFDLVTCLGSLEHFVDPEKALREMLRVGTPKAKFLILVPNQGFFLRRLGFYHGTRQTVAREVVRPLSEWQCLFEEAGLRIEARWKNLHVRLLEFLSTVPLHLKIRGNETKRLLREFVRPRFKHVAKRRKHGFEAPVGNR